MLVELLLACAPQADLVLRGGAFWTADPERPRAEWIAISDGRIDGLGEGPVPAGQIDAQTRVVELGGRRVLPGLIDAHVHLAGAAEAAARLNVRGLASRDALLAAVAARAEQLEDGAWVLGRGWSAESWPDARAPHADELDAASGGRPTVLVRMDGHSLIASSSALRLAGIDAEGPDDPAGGKIGRGPDGMPDGALYESAMGLLTSLVPASTVEDERAWMRRVLAEANSYGLTQVGAIEPRRSIDQLLVPLDRAGELSLRVRATVRDAGPSLDAWLRALERIEEDLDPSPRVRVLGFKGFMDGSLGSRTAWMLEPFADDSDNAGFPLALAGSGELRTLIGIAAVRGLQPAVHAIGDRANRTLLDWYGELDAEQRAALRPRIEHAQHLHADDIARFTRLGVVASMQPLHKADDGRYAEERLGAERCATSYAFRDLVDGGARLAFGSDWPVVSCDPWRGIAAAVTGQTLDGATFVPEQNLTVEEALTAYTTGAAFALHSEDSTGRLALGYLADLVVLDSDPLAARTHDEIVSTQVRATLVGGVVVAGSLDALVSEGGDGGR